MPPAPRITASLNEARYAELCASLGLSEPPPVRFVTNGKPGKFYGVYYPGTGSITIFCNFTQFEVGRLVHAQGHLLETLLHELRHAHQKKKYGADWYRKNVVQAENDANDYAAKNRHLWRGVLVVKRTQHGSGFSQLGRHASGRMV